MVDTLYSFTEFETATQGRRRRWQAGVHERLSSLEDLLEVKIRAMDHRVKLMDHKLTKIMEAIEGRILSSGLPSSPKLAVEPSPIQDALEDVSSCVQRLEMLLFQTTFADFRTIDANIASMVGGPCYGQDGFVEPEVRTPPTEQIVLDMSSDDKVDSDSIDPRESDVGQCTAFASHEQEEAESEELVENTESDNSEGCEDNDAVHQPVPQGAVPSFDWKQVPHIGFRGELLCKAIVYSDAACQIRSGVLDITCSHDLQRNVILQQMDKTYMSVKARWLIDIMDDAWGEGWFRVCTPDGHCIFKPIDE